MLRELWKSVASVSAAKAYSLVVAAANIMIVARWLGPSGQGVVAAAMTWAALFGTLGSLSLGQVAIHRATVRRGEEWLSDAMGTLLVLAAVITVGCWAVAAILYAATHGRAFGHVEPHALFVAFLAAPFIVWEFYGSNLLMAIGQIGLYNRAQLVGRTAGLLLMFVCWRLGFGVVAALSTSVFAQMVVASTGIRSLWLAAGARVRATFREARALLTGAVQLHVNAISSYVFLSLGVLIVNHYCSAAETGWYQFATSLVNVVLVIPAAAALVLSSHVAQLGPDRAWAVHRKVLVYLSAFMIVASAIAAALAPIMIPLVAGPKYTPAIHLFQVSLLGVVGLTLSAIMGSQWIGRGYFWQMSVISVIFAVIQLTAMLLLVPRHGMYGAVYANVITSAATIVTSLAFAWFCEVRLRTGIGVVPEVRASDLVAGVAK